MSDVENNNEEPVKKDFVIKPFSDVRSSQENAGTYHYQLA